jgi:hypothetical protein
MIKSNRIFSAVRAADAADWGLGDALLKELGPSTASGFHKRVVACAEELADLGFDYGPQELRRSRLRAVPPERRWREASWSLHAEARNPDVLDVMLASDHMPAPIKERRELSAAIRLSLALRRRPKSTTQI